MSFPEAEQRDRESHNTHRGALSRKKATRRERTSEDDVTASFFGGVVRLAMADSTANSTLAPPSLEHGRRRARERDGDATPWCGARSLGSHAFDELPGRVAEKGNIPHPSLWEMGWCMVVWCNQPFAQCGSAR